MRCGGSCVGIQSILFPSAVGGPPQDSGVRRVREREREHPFGPKNIRRAGESEKYSGRRRGARQSEKYPTRRSTMRENEYSAMPAATATSAGRRKSSSSSRDEAEGLVDEATAQQQRGDPAATRQQPVYGAATKQQRSGGVAVARRRWPNER